MGWSNPFRFEPFALRDYNTSCVAGSILRDERSAVAMNQELIEVLKHCKPAKARQRLNLSARDLDARVLQLTESINGQDESPEGQAIIDYTTARTYESAAEANGTSGPLNYPPELGELRDWVCRYYRAQQRKYHTPEFLEQSRQSINEEEILAALREVGARGVVGIQDLIDGLEEEVKPGE